MGDEYEKPADTMPRQRISDASEPSAVDKVRASVDKTVKGANTGNNLDDKTVTEDRECDPDIWYQENEAKGSSKLSFFGAFDANGDAVTIHAWAKALAQHGPRGMVARSNFKSVLESNPYKAMLFESKAASNESAKREHFEFVLLDSPSLYNFAKDEADIQSFAEHFCKPGDPYGVAFDNIRRDARLVAPRPLQTNLQPYSHLTAFICGASEDQVLEVIRMVAFEYLKRLS